jgi:hypothetical protein
MPKSKIADMLYNCNEIIDATMKQQRPYSVVIPAVPNTVERRKTVRPKQAMQQIKVKTRTRKKDFVDDPQLDNSGWHYLGT